MRSTWVLLVAVVVACGKSATQSGQSLHDGVQALCDLPDHVPPPAPYEQRLAGVASWAHDHVTNAEAKSLGGLDQRGNKDALAAAVKKAGIAQCKLLDNGMALQSFADAMKLACAAPPDPAYFRAHLLNPEVIQLLGALGNLSPQDRAARLHDAIARAHVASCPVVEAAMHVPADVPKVHGAGFVPADYPALAVVATDHGIVIDGKSVVAVTNGAVDPAEIDGGALGIEIHRVHDFIKAAADELATRGTPTRVQLVIAPALPYRLLVQLTYSAKRAGVTDFGLVVSVADALAAIPIRIPDRRPPGMTPTGLQLLVAITDDKLTLWSVSGSEGTLQKPKLVTTNFDELAKALAEIRDRRWPDGKRPDADRSIVVLADSGMAVQRVADVLAVLRATADGKELFPDVVLSSAFE